MRALIAPDKFKGSLTAMEAAAAMEAGLRAGWPEAGWEVACRPIADGGEGTAEVICTALGGHWVEWTVADPLGRPVIGRYALVKLPGGPGILPVVRSSQHGRDADATLAVLETSSASGYLRVAPGERDLPRSSTFGTGELLRHALETPALDGVILGIGGSATNDGGLGLAAALGYRFMNAEGRDIQPVPAGLHALRRIVPPKNPPMERDGRLIPLTVACDVRNPLLGPRGATRVYGPQKGLRDDAERDLLEAGLERLADVAAESLGVDFRDTPGAGAAGGLGYGLLTFCGAVLEPGFELVAQLSHLEAEVAAADVILTGEGSLDVQTLEGKGPAALGSWGRRHGKVVVAFAGRIDPAAETGLREYFDVLCPLGGGVLTIEDCIGRAGPLLEQAVARAAGLLRAGARMPREATE